MTLITPDIEITIESFREIKHELERDFCAEVRIDPITRLLYSTDASIYQIEPLGVFFPRSRENLRDVVGYCARKRIPMLPRGSGSSLAGQAVGRALIIDCSRYLDKTSINPEEKTAWVEPGVVLSRLNQQAGEHGLQFGPDPASGERATIGGMIGNNATGAHSIRYGMTGDHLLEIIAVLADGEEYKLGPVGIGQIHDRSRGSNMRDRLFNAAIEIRERYSNQIRQRWPRTWRNASGYALNYLVPWSASAPPAWDNEGYPSTGSNEINLAPLLAGSEGTLGLVSSAKIRLVDRPEHKVLVVLEFRSLIAAVEAAPGMLEYGPSAVELVPRAILERARRIPAYASRLDFMQSSPEALLLVEFAGDEKKQLVEQAKQISDGGLLLQEESQQKKIWEVRKVGLGLLMSVAGDSKPVPFVEDIAVPVEELASFVCEFQRILEAHGTQGDFYAHASAGCLHIRPWINLKQADGIEMMRSIGASLVPVVIKHGGALSGEHGDGIARAGWLTEIYGEELVGAFRMLKQAADPNNLLNPGKVIDPLPMDQNLRFGADYSSLAWNSELDFSNQEDLAGAIEMCNGAGVCRKFDPGMCPTFQATRDEMHSTRGRANLLRALISGRHPVDMAPAESAFEALELCLACKACKAECPSGVDMAKLKYAFLDKYYQRRLRPLRDYLFAYIGELARVGRTFRGILNPLLNSGLGKTLLSVLGIAKERTFPSLSSSKRFGNENKTIERVIFVSDPFTEYFTAELEMQARTVLERVGCQVIKLKQIGTGRTKLSKGFISAAKRDAGKILEELKRIDPAGITPVVGIEPSEVATLTDDILSLFPHDQYAEKLSARAYSLEEFLLRADENAVARINKLKGTPQNIDILLHGHCYQKAQKLADDGLPNGVDATAELFRAFGCQVELIDSGCCGMAGAFGYEEKHYEISRQVAELHLAPAVRAKREGQVVVASGASCRTQIADLAEEEALHPVTVLFKMLEKLHTEGP